MKKCEFCKKLFRKHGTQKYCYDCKNKYKNKLYRKPEHDNIKKEIKNKEFYEQNKELIEKKRVEYLEKRNEDRGQYYKRCKKLIS